MVVFTIMNNPHIYNDMNLKTYYKHYITLHQNPKCRLLHFLGQITTILFIIFILYKNYWLMTLLIPFIVYPFAWSVHYFLKKTHPQHLINPFILKF